MWLPEEILGMIFSHLQPSLERPQPWTLDDNRNRRALNKLKMRTLASVVLANKACYRIAQPYLYRTVELWEHYSQLKLFLRTLIHHPKFAREVHTLSLNRYKTLEEVENRSASLEPDSSTTGPDVAKHWLAAVQDLQMSNLIKEEVRDGICRGHDVDSDMIALLTLCENLEVFDFADWSPGSSPRLLAAVGEASKAHNGYPLRRRLLLPHVTTFILWHIDEDGENDMYGMWNVDLQDVSPYLCLPALKEFHGACVWIDDTGCAQLRPDCSKLTQIDVYITTDIHDKDCFSRFLEAFSNLRALKVSWARDGPGITFKDIGNALRLHGRGLERLKLLFGPRDDLVNNGFGDLKDLTKLSELNVSDRNLTGRKLNYASRGDRDYELLTSNVADLLPSSLEFLRLDMDDHDYRIESLMLRARILKSKLSKLSRILLTHNGCCHLNGVKRDGVWVDLTQGRDRDGVWVDTTKGTNGWGAP